MFRNNLLKAFFAGIILMVFLYACKEHESLPDSSFDLLQTKILTPSCATTGCHASKSDATYLQHELVLEKSVAFANLINVKSKNANAQADNLVRVKPFDAEASLFLRKLHLFDLRHTSDYGNPMPLGLTKLTVGQVEFIEQWIIAGAPRTGTVADASLLDDQTAQTENFVPLAAPETGKGFQVNLSKFQVAANFEREFFVYKSIGNTADVFVNRFEINMRLNSHHLVVYDFNGDIPALIFPQKEAIRDIRNSDGSLNGVNMLPMGYHVYVIGAQSPYTDFQFPAGVALKVKANAALDFNSHYVNKEPAPIVGEVNVNFHTVAASSVQKEAKTINFANTSITLNPSVRTTLSKTFTVSKSISVITLTSHTHQLGEKFVIKIVGGTRNGEVVYTSTDWHHPQFNKYDPPILLQPGQGLASEITYNNKKSTTVKWGLTSEDEMGIIFGYYTEN